MLTFAVRCKICKMQRVVKILCSLYPCDIRRRVQICSVGFDPLWIMSECCMSCSVCRSMFAVAGVVVSICGLVLCFCVQSFQADCISNIDLPVQDLSCPLCRSYEAEAFNISLFLTLAWNFELAIKWLYVNPDVELKHRVHSRLAHCHV